MLFTVRTRTVQVTGIVIYRARARFLTAIVMYRAHTHTVIIAPRNLLTVRAPTVLSYRDYLPCVVERPN